MITREQLQPFCSLDETRHQLGKPYIRHGDTYATDGRIAVRAFGRVEGAEVHEDYPNAAAAIDPLPKTGPWLQIELPDGADVDMPCPNCTDDDTTCPACSGLAEVTGHYRFRDRHYDLSGPCPVCAGEGVCPKCEGSGKTHDETPVRLGRNYYKARYLRLLLALPEAELCEGDDMEPARIRFDGGDGGIMPVDVEQWNDHCKANGEPERVIVV